MYPLATNPAKSDLTISETPAYRSTPKSKTNRYGTIQSPRLGCNPFVVGVPWSCVALPLPSEVPPNAHAPPASGLPRTTLLLTGLVTRIASSNRIHHHSG